MFICCSCSKKESVKKTIQEHHLCKFFQYMLLESGGAYTLFGDKPVTLEDISYPNDDDLKKLKQCREEILKKNPNFKFRTIEKTLNNDWKMSKDYLSALKMDNFIFIEVFPDHFFPRESLIVFINIEKTALTLQKYYSEFSRELQMDFDPLKTVYEIKDPTSKFWQGVWKKPFLLGLLLGYGYENSRLCSWCIQHNDSTCPEIKSFITFLHEKAYGADTNDPLIKYPIKLDGKPFRLPIFACHDKETSQALIEKYKRQRKEILRIYKNKDFLQVILSKLQNNEP